MNRRIIIHNEAEVLPTTLVLRTSEDSVGGSLEVEGIEVYADSDCKILIADDLQYDKLPPSSQMALDAALAAHNHQLWEARNCESIRLTRQPVITNADVWRDFFTRIAG